MSLVVNSPEQLKRIIIAVYKLNEQLNVIPRADTPTPLNIYLWGPAGTGKTTTCIDIAKSLNLPSGYKILTCHPEMTTDSLLGPIDISKLVIHNEIKRNPALGIGGESDLTIMDEMDVLPRWILETLKSLLTSTNHCDAAGCYRSKAGLVIATANTPLEELLRQKRIPEETAEALMQRFPVRIEYTPTISFESFTSFTTLDVPAAVRIGSDLVSTCTLFYTLTNKLNFSARQVTQFIALLTSNLEACEICSLFNLELGTLLGLIRQEASSVEVRNAISLVEAVVKRLPTELDTPQKVKEALAILGTDASMLPDATLNEAAIVKSFLETAKEEFFRRSNLNTLPTCDNAELNETLAAVVQQLRSYGRN